MFDRFVVVDWSASSRPKRGADSIWIATCDGGDHGTVVSHNAPTRAAASEMLEGLVADGSDVRTLVGVDVSLGFPAGTAEALGCRGAPWRDTWALLHDLVDDDVHNDNNRFEVAAELNRRIGHPVGPFWGCPPSQVRPRLAPTKPASFGGLGEWRYTEQVLREGGLRPFSVWQLLGAGAVGSQTLLGIPWFEQLFRRYETIGVWPFTTGLERPDLPSGGVVLAEVWPSMFPVGDGAPRDRAQVESTAHHLAWADRTGRLQEWFRPAVPVAQRSAVVHEEGWTLGVAVPDAASDARELG